MPLKKLTLKTTFEHQNLRLDHVLAQWMPEVLKVPVSKGKIRKLIVAGAVYLNEKRVKIASKTLLPQAKIDVYVDLKKLFQDSTERDVPFEMTSDHILYEDETLIAVNKPAGIPTQPTLDESRLNLFVSVKKYLARREGIPHSALYLGLHHRLDRDTSGVILFTKAKEANPGIAALFSTHQARKTYQALVTLSDSAPVQDDFEHLHWTVQNYLGKVTASGKKAKFGSVRSGGDYAKTEFTVIEALKRGLWVEAKPLTGRTHQIRVHLAESGMPIQGDVFYGGRDREGSVRFPRVMLHASQLAFQHPLTGINVAIDCPIPEDFQKCLDALRIAKS